LGLKTFPMNRDIQEALKHVGAITILFLVIVLVGELNSWVATTVTSALVGAGAALMVAAFKKQKAAPKLVAGWAIIAGLFGLLVSTLG